MRSSLLRSQVFWCWFCVGIYCGLIFGLSSLSQPLPFLKPENYPPDWILHGVEYAFLGALLVRALNASAAWPSKALLFFVTVFLAALYGVSDEWHQSFVPGRQVALHDIVVDAIGSLIGASLWVIRKYRKIKNA